MPVLVMSDFDQLVSSVRKSVGAHVVTHAPTISSCMSMLTRAFMWDLVILGRTIKRVGNTCEVGRPSDVVASFLTLEPDKRATVRVFIVQGLDEPGPYEAARPLKEAGYVAIDDDRFWTDANRYNVTLQELFGTRMLGPRRRSQLVLAGY